MLDTKARLLSVLNSAEQHRGDPPALGAITLPNDDDDESSESVNIQGFGPAEGQSFIIEYVDSRRESSRRRITVWSIVAGRGGIPCLLARCHERGADRSFRIDRIQTIIDYDGEVHDNVATYLQECLGLSNALSGMSSAREAEKAERLWERCLEISSPYAQLLTALSLSDGDRHDSEIAVASDFCMRICEENGLECNHATASSFRSYLRHLRPRSGTYERALDRILETSSSDALGRFLLTARDLIEADQRVHPAEVAMIEDIYFQLIGIPMPTGSVSQY